MPTGVVDLPLKCAREWDVDGLGHAYWEAGCPAGDAREEYYRKRAACYRLVVDALQTFNQQYQAVIHGPDRIIADELRVLTETAYGLALSSTDDAFHAFLYDSMIASGQKDDLVQVRFLCRYNNRGVRADLFVQLNSPFIEGYLSRTPITLERAELLHLLYVRLRQYLRAAETCAALAESQDFEQSLERRTQLFTFAVNYAKSHPSSELGRHEAAVEFLSDLEEKLEVAQVQVEVYHELYSRLSSGSFTDRQALERLNRTLLNISEVCFLL